MRYNNGFEQSRTLFAGDLQDDLPAHLDAAASRAHTQQFHHWQALNRQMGDNAHSSPVTATDDVADCDMLTYYWPRNKPETQLQLMNLLSLLPVGTDIFVVSENRSGVHSAEQTLASYTPLNKVDNVRCCGLYFGRLKKQPVSDAEKFWGEYSVGGLMVKALPGMFGRGGLDVGNQLLLLTLTPHTKGKVLDVDCGIGVLSVVFVRHSSEIRLTLCDTSAPAIETGCAAFAANGVGGEVFASNVFSEVKGRFDMIVPNPPSHDGM